MGKALTKSPDGRPGSRSQPTDEELLLRFRDQGDQAAFDQLVHRYERELYSYLRRYLGNPDAAEDVFQGAFLRLYQKADQYQPGRRVRPWLYSIATHLAIDWLRKAGRRRAVSLNRREYGDGETEGAAALLDMLEAETPGPAANVEFEERREWARRAVDELPEHLRAVVLLVFFQGLKYTEVAEALDIPVGTVKSRLHAALVKLNAAWRQQQSATDH